MSIFILRCGRYFVVNTALVNNLTSNRIEFYLYEPAEPQTVAKRGIISSFKHGNLALLLPDNWITSSRNIIALISNAFLIVMFFSLLLLSVAQLLKAERK